MSNSEYAEHTIQPFYFPNSKILILGSFPSVKSRESMFYYGHPQNRFWKVLAAVLKDEVPMNNNEKQAFLKRHQIALWDVIKSCEIKGSSDLSIRNVVPNPIGNLLLQTEVSHIFINGKTAEKLFLKYCKDDCDCLVTTLPSTSPANAAWSLERLVECWSILSHSLKGEI